MADKTVFQKIIDREIPAQILFENDNFIIIDNIAPVAPIHYLVIPKTLIPSIDTVTDETAPIVGELFACAAQFLREKGIRNFKLIFNGGKYLHVPHLHLHLLSGDDLRD
jgi:histidine triad (HIT) family protein